MDCAGFSRRLAMARRTLVSAMRDVEGGDYNWACFEAHQAAGFAMRGLLHCVGKPARGHSVFRLLGAAGSLLSVPGELVELGKLLDKFYVPTRHVDARSEGAPFEYFTGGDAEVASAAAKRVPAFVEGYGGGVDSGRG